APGEWHVDAEAKTLYFWPPGGKLSGEVVVPALNSIVAIEGDTKGGPLVTCVRLTGLALRDCRGAAVKLTGARECAVTACDFRNVDLGVRLGDETHACRVAGCDITQTGQEPILLIGDPARHERVSDHIIDNNYIHDFGYGDYNNAHAGVVLWSVARCRVTHNHIHDGPRFGVSYNGGNDNVIAYNHLHHMNIETCDTGLIYTVTSVDWGKPDEEARRATNLGNEIHHNLLHDAGGYGRDSANKFEYPHYSWGIYLDLASSGWSVHDNVVYNTTLGGYHVNGGSSNVCRNNVLVNARQTQCRIAPWPKYEMSGNRFEGNVLANLKPGAALYDLGPWKPEHVTFDRNLVYCGGEAPRVRATAVRGPGRDIWGKWQALGQDTASVVADPLFVAPGKQDYTLPKSSPAFKLGFKPIDLSGVGNYASAERRTWPRPEVKVFREPADYSPRRDAAAQPPRRDYEDYAVGDGERGAHVGEEGGTVRVSDETAAGGKHSLKFTDVGGLKYPWVPYVAYVWEVDEGVLHGGFDLRWDTGAEFVYEWRDDPAVYSLGPNLSVDAQGFLAANGKRLLQMPPGQWVRFDVTCGIGDHATGKYDLTVKLPGGAPQVFKDLDCNPKFQSLQQFVIMSMTNGPSAFYVDNLEINAVAAK
ncbi:MAG: right-handed parallel beta-helix repeat-containing protein, partial [Armatimonadetes bacterium]|nr:right-handed parallel beta-helix repeat-containing protein [Armatimonadota bacterium]